ncbi:paraquat-inducible protein B [Paraglaciecola mesophila KMM 241]|uniref:Paraquat-inducible protein B n=1 Tax=Paraglaciecola mesophila KMM 241 TaxID=1128912 RepID=K6ZRV7_9ALTE|nr:intermembrane transport protein PqiB [Paraglaciecola mesophila]GAC26030.1 paraquat-inducible protein B [Paraglaciecola mesophila KMM 241]
MHENGEPADITNVKSISKIWLVPIVAICMGAWMFYHQWSNQGPLINIVFENASGLEVGKTKIKMHNVDVGEVKTIALTEDLQKVLVTARMSANSEGLLRESTEFWAVNPRISLNGISGLNTLVSGTYINMSTNLEGPSSRDFVALSAPPITPSGTPGLHVTLNSDAEFAFKEGDPVIYKGLKVGEFESIYFNFEERIVYYNTFIQAPYHKLITTNTKFWNTSGVEMDIGANGFKVKSSSIETLITNGVAFGVPEGMPQGNKVSERSYFNIHDSYDSAAEERYKESAKFVILVEDTVRGLHVGAPVEYRGIKVGKVLDINPPNANQQKWLDAGVAIPVVIGIQPGRVEQTDDDIGIEFINRQITTWVENGFRASLQTGNLLTGALFVNLEQYANVPSVEMEKFQDYPVIPSISNEFSQITEKVSAILDNINDMDLIQLSEAANKMMDDISASANSMNSTADDFAGTLKQMKEQQVSAKLANALEGIEELTSGFSSGSRTNNEINETLDTLQQRLRELQPLLLELNQAPNSLIFDKAPKPYLQPGIRKNNTQQERK